MKLPKLNRLRLTIRENVLAVASAGVVVLALGCGGGGGNGGGAGSDDKTLSGTNLEVAAGVVAAKATTAGVAVPFAVLNEVNAASMALRPFDGSWTLVPNMGLYENIQASGKTLTINFATDSKGASKAGSIVVQGSQTIGSAYTFPAAFNVTGNITGGAVPLQAQFALTLTDSKGANTLKGALQLTKDSTNVAFDLSLDDSGNVASAGQILATYTYVHQGISVPLLVQFAQLSGTPGTAIASGSATVEANVPFIGPQDGEGTGSLDLVHGSVTLTITSGTLIALVEDFNGLKNTLTVQAGGGFQDIIDNATSFNLATLLTKPTTTTTTGGGSGSYLAPVAIKGTGAVTVEQALGDGEMVGLAHDASGLTTGYYWSSPTASPVTLGAPSGGSHTAAYGIESAGGLEQIVGSYQATSGLLQPCLWILKSGTWQPNAIGAVLPYGGVFRGISPNGKNTIVGFSYSATGVKQPFAFINATVYPLPTDNRKGDLSAIAVDDNNDILGSGSGGAPVPGVWAQAAVTGSSITTPFKALTEPADDFGGPFATAISDNGVIVGGDGFDGVYWQSSDGFAPHALAFGSNASAMGVGVNHAGTKATGQLYATSPSNIADICYWSALTTAPVDVTKKLGTLAGTYQTPEGSFLLDNGSIIATSPGGSATAQYLYIQSK